jgi:hypothetical protein
MLPHKKRSLGKSNGVEQLAAVVDLIPSKKPAITPMAGFESASQTPVIASLASFGECLHSQPPEASKAIRLTRNIHLPNRGHRAIAGDTNPNLNESFEPYLKTREKVLTLPTLKPLFLVRS